MARQSKKRAFEDAQAQSTASSICVADIVKVVAFDEANMTVDVQPITRYPDEDSFQTKPQVLAVPVAMIYGGGWAFRPVYQAGDIGVVLYLDRDSDAVIAGGAEADPNTERLHSGMTPSSWGVSASGPTPFLASPPGPSAWGPLTGTFTSP